MQRLALLLMVLGSIFIATPFLLGEKPIVYSAKTKVVTQMVQKTVVPFIAQEMPSNTTKVELKSEMKNIKLEKRNSVVFRGVVTDNSVTQVMAKLQEMSQNLNKNDEIYLVLDTPGGSIFAGLDLIEFTKGLPQKVNTVTLFAASMGFQFAQALGTRYITETGVLMSHRGALSGLGGQINGELESRYKLYKRSVDILDTISSKRMKMSLKEYQDLILNEYWVFGLDSVNEKAADETVTVSCGTSLNGTTEETVQTLFGAVNLNWSDCPLLKYPLKVEFNGLVSEEAVSEEIKKYFKTLFFKKREFVSNYIINNNYERFQK